MKKSLLKVSFISIMAIIISGSAFGAVIPTLGDDVPVLDPVSPDGPGGGGQEPAPGGGDIPPPTPYCPNPYSSEGVAAMHENNAFGTATSCPEGYYIALTAAGNYCSPCDIDMPLCFNSTTTSGLYCPGITIEDDDLAFYYSRNLDLGRCQPGQVVDLSQFNGTEGSECVTPTPSRTPRRIAKDETSPECDDTTLGTASGSTDFEADWTANTINITWVGNGATVSGGASTCTYDKSFNLPTAPTKTGYNFAGWKVVNQQ